MAKFKSNYTTQKKWVIVNQERVAFDKLELEFDGWKVSRSVLGSNSVMLTCERTIK